MQAITLLAHIRIALKYMTGANTEVYFAPWASIKKKKFDITDPKCKCYVTLFLFVRDA
jgi:hypothetical protein